MVVFFPHLRFNFLDMSALKCSVSNAVLEQNKGMKQYWSIKQCFYLLYIPGLFLSTHCFHTLRFFFHPAFQFKHTGSTTYIFLNIVEVYDS